VGAIVSARASQTQPWTLVWVDAREAVIVRWLDGEASVQYMESEVPAHHRATGHVGHDAVRLAGAGPPRSAGETHRHEHLRQFLSQIRGRLPASDGLAILGSGPLVGQLARLITEDDRLHRRDRPVRARQATRPTDRQLIAELRELVGEPPTRGVIGAYRWTGPQPLTAAGRPRPPRRVVARARERRIKKVDQPESG
jgi:hypothetical protein